jgi:hypothetical protein
VRGSPFFRTSVSSTYRTARTRHWMTDGGERKV